MVHPPNVASSSTLNSTHTTYSLSLLTEYASTLDTLPIELSRNFADLRELDAVLTASMANISAKVSLLITLIETRQGTPLQRLQLLSQIAEEAERVKLGGDDKIKVASQAADNLRNQYGHLTTLLTCMPDFDPAMLVKRTTFPHVSPNMFIPPPYESGRRRRAPNSGGLLLGSGDGSPHKRRRVVHDEDLDYGAPNRTPRKDKEGGQPRQRARAKKVERQPSPTDSFLSVASPMPGQAVAVIANGNSRSAQSSNRPSNNAKRRNNNANANTSADPNPHLAPSSSTGHPSLIDSFAKQEGKIWNANGDSKQGSNSSNGHNGLEGPGVSANHRASTHSSLNGVTSGSPAPANNRNGGDCDDKPDLKSYSVNGNGHAVDGHVDGHADAYEDGGGNASVEMEAEVDAEGDDKTYCICNCVSFGQMIGCDGDSCETEWFHLTCIGLSKPPSGKWYCDACTAKQAKKRSANNNRSKKRANNRGVAKAVANA